MKKTCEEWMEEYLMLDKGERIPLKLSRHLISCKKCRNAVKALSHAEKLAAEPLKIQTPIKSDTITNIMKDIDPAYTPKKEKYPLLKWILTGLFILAAMSMFTALTSYRSNTGMTFAYYFVFAAIVVGYCAMFVGTNLDFFIKKINTMTF